MITRAILLSLSLATALALTGCSDIIKATSEGPIQDDPKSRTTGNFIDDELVEIKTLVNIGKASKALSNAHISVTSYNGIVLLTGQVPSEESRALAESVAKQTRKVRKVHNELTISGPTSHIVRTNDAWITTKVKASMLGSDKVNAADVKVVTENGIVYLLGLVSRQEADRAVGLVRESHGVQKIVKMFEYVD
ncbi:BON domain-containing protein [Motiliproteus sp. MSK22-1]|uniref:BON domain-containing protein n=1 Tax=Motiliproteus sp. MSK22-1 TaxID=1897630 RepID=UPI000977FE48|nr:BON domain-containing protein [Motiliproteus sp. MSK22-1]OMH36524.1 phospholipid-binding protein [Motiliproteus sp. MSK22-1]